MSASRWAAGLAVVAALSHTLCASATGASPDPTASDLQRCAVIAAPDSRLACYDALAHRAATAASRSQPSSPSTGTLAVQAAPTPAAAAPAPGAGQSPSAAADAKNFGLTPAQQHIAFAGPQSIAAHIDSIGTDSNGQTRIGLDNGETWAVMDNDGWLSQGDAVTIRRAALGSFLLLAPTRHSYHVRRLR